MHARLLPFALVLLVGCAPTAPADPQPRRLTEAEREAFREQWGSVSAAAAPHAGSVAVAEGPAPLAYITERAGDVWVTDSAGRRWGPVAAGTRAVVRVAEQTGVAIGPIRLDPGPLPEGRTYSIHLGSPADTGWRNGSQQGIGAPAAH
jgi:hypothetical protein